MIGILHLALTELRTNRARSLISASGIGLGIGLFTLVIALGLGVRDLVLKEVVRELPVTMIEVIPKSLDLGLFKIDTDALFGARALDTETVERLRKIAGVQAVYPRLSINLPIGAQGGAEIFGRRLYTDLFMTGVPKELLELDGTVSFIDNPNIVPVVISDQLIDIYNASVAPALHAPKLTPQTLNGFEFELVFGRSLMLGSGGARRTGNERAQIVGTSKYAIRLGATVPIETARRILATYAMPDTQEHYSSVIVQAKDANDIPSIAQGVEGLGFAVDRSAQVTRDMMSIGTTIAALVALLVLALAALNIAHSLFATVSERQRELAILRAVGARAFDLLSLVLCQAALLGLLGGLFGLVGARMTALAIDAVIHFALPELPFRPPSFFEFPLWLFILGLAAAAGAAIAGAFAPALRASRVSVAQALAEL